VVCFPFKIEERVVSHHLGYQLPGASWTVFAEAISVHEDGARNSRGVDNVTDAGDMQNRSESSQRQG
jgi:hypothetical protein